VACGGENFEPAQTSGSTTGGAADATSASADASTASSASSGAGGAGGGAGEGGQGGGAGGASDCTPVTLGEVLLLDAEPGGSSVAYALLGLDAAVEHALFVEFYDVAGPPTTGTFDLSLPPDDDYATCAHCLFAFEDVNGPTPTPYFQSGGNPVVTTADTEFTGVSGGNFDGVVLSEVTLTGTTTTPVPGGKCLSLSGSWVSTGG